MILFRIIIRLGTGQVKSMLVRGFEGRLGMVDSLSLDNCVELEFGDKND
jgi:hypothetical protein